MQIKTIKFKIDAAEAFDNEVNRALENGWALTKREVLPPYEGQSYVHHRMLYAELQKEMSDTDISIQEENRVLRARLQHLLRSETVRQFDLKDPDTDQYVRDITQLDNMCGTIKDLDGGIWYQDADKQGWTKE